MLPIFFTIWLFQTNSVSAQNDSISISEVPSLRKNKMIRSVNVGQGHWKTVYCYPPVGLSVLAEVDAMDRFERVKVAVIFLDAQGHWQSTDDKISIDEVISWVKINDNDWKDYTEIGNLKNESGAPVLYLTKEKEMVIGHSENGNLLLNRRHEHMRESITKFLSLEFM